MPPKKEKLPLGPSFPFIENKDGKGAMPYDAIKVTYHSGRISIIFIQGDLEIYAYSYDVDNTSSYEVVFKEMRGEVNIEFST